MPAALELRQGRFSLPSVPCINLTGGCFPNHNDWNNNTLIHFSKRWRKERLAHMFLNTERCPECHSETTGNLTTASLEAPNSAKPHSHSLETLQSKCKLCLTQKQSLNQMTKREEKQGAGERRGACRQQNLQIPGGSLLFGGKSHSCSREQAARRDPAVKTHWGMTVNFLRCPVRCHIPDTKQDKRKGGGTESGYSMTKYLRKKAKQRNGTTAFEQTLHALKCLCIK